MIKFFRIILRICILFIFGIALFIHLKLPSYTNAMEHETSELNKQLKMLSNQKNYELILIQSDYSDVEVIKQDMIPSLENEKKSLMEQYKALFKENRLLNGQLNILTTKIIFDTTSNRLKLVKRGKIVSDIPVYKKFVQDFLKSEIDKKILKVLAKEKMPTPIRPVWTFEDITVEIPAENSPERLMTGALGNYAIYFTDFLIIHDKSKNYKYHDTINHVCIQLNTKAMKKFYDSIYVGNKLYVE
ncbi:MAG: L,D-transpeptidase [Elusimicrobia bacterium]|nr:L,D-transpeptidase [Elusimicrobiota bacterium]